MERTKTNFCSRLCSVCFLLSNLCFQVSAHGGRHIHLFRDNRPLGVFDRRDGPIRGLETVWNADLREAIDRFIIELNERGDWI
jgi:hypothetical protein